MERTTASRITRRQAGETSGQTDVHRVQEGSMRFRAPATDRRDEEVTVLESLLRRVVGARVRDPDTVDDLVQEALARVIAVRGRLDDEAVTPYAIGTARNLVTTLAREQERGGGH